MCIQAGQGRCLGDEHNHPPAPAAATRAADRAQAAGTALDVPAPVPPDAAARGAPLGAAGVTGTVPEMLAGGTVPGMLAAQLPPRTGQQGSGGQEQQQQGPLLRQPAGSDGTLGYVIPGAGHQAVQGLSRQPLGITLPGLPATAPHQAAYTSGGLPGAPEGWPIPVQGCAGEQAPPHQGAGGPAAQGPLGTAVGRAHAGRQMLNETEVRAFLDSGLASGGVSPRKRKEVLSLLPQQRPTTVVLSAAAGKV
jgi:hypothetical protein